MLMRSSRFTSPVCLLMILLSTSAVKSVAVAQDEPSVSPLTEEGKLIVFERDIAPIFEKNCLECHGPDDAKSGFRIDDREYVLDYLEPGDAENSSLYIDYMIVDDIDWLMPPTTHGGPLSASDLALIRVWLNEGADWPEDYEFGGIEKPVETEPVEPTSRTLTERVWAAQGYLHPATVHFPIALFLLGGGFVVLGLKWPKIGTQVPLACLLLGAATSVASSAMGWAFAPERGYGSGWNLLDWGREVDAHRWSALVVTLVSVVLASIALVSLRNGSERLTKIWKVGLLLCAVMVGAVGHQGGELSYGEDFYPRMFRILFDTPEEDATAESEDSTEETEQAEADAEA